jgi:hypothetical protein
MRITLLVMTLLFGCERTEVTAKEHLEVLLGEEVECFEVHAGEGFLCRSKSGRNYYCPKDKRSFCFFSSRLQLLDPPIEKPNQ